MSMSIRGMKRVTPRVVQDNSAAVRILKTETGRTKDGLKRLVCQVKTRPSNPAEVKQRYHLIVQATKPGKKLSEDSVRVYCECKFFTYYGCADVLYKRGACWQKYATGIMPDIRNPRYIPFVCKHLFRVFELIERKKM